MIDIDEGEGMSEAENLGIQRSDMSDSDIPQIHSPQVSRLRYLPASHTAAYPVRTKGSSAGGRLMAVTEAFSAEHKGFAPATFTRAIPGRQMRVVTYMVAAVVDRWQVPVPWWEPAPGGDDVSMVLASLSRTVWRVEAIPAVSYAGHHICASVLDIACDPDGTWSVVRIHD